jgi:acyl-homoserine lactone acylase PvdQ
MAMAMAISTTDSLIATHAVEVKFAPYIPAFKASNNWVIGPQLTKSGSPLQVRSLLSSQLRFSFRIARMADSSPY